MRMLTELQGLGELEVQVILWHLSTSLNVIPQRQASHFQILALFFSHI
ncbi:MAG: hypothetical protein KAI15_01870 [Gammaproteobacteria bacterium]|nr:hypothetical protein [Gammaproteobacteria bacterium]